MTVASQPEVPDPALLELLVRYSPAGAADRDIWRDRINAWPGLSAAELTRRHGALLAAAWIELNTGQSGGCYRLTPAGRRVLRQAGGAHKTESHSHASTITSNPP
jgi:hypothetical protein